MPNAEMNAATKPVPAPTLRSSWATVGGLRMHARIATNAAPAGAKAVVLVHGVGV